MVAVSTNYFFELDDTPWVGVFSNDWDEDMVANVASFAGWFQSKVKMHMSFQVRAYKYSTK